jgi:cytochrome c biogenesis protein ResB
MDVERGEWKSYRMKYVHPIETASVTAYLTAIGDAHYLDVMPPRGEDRGSFLVPVHAVLRVRLEEDRLELTPLSYDWFDDRLRARQPIGGLNAVQDQKANALIVSPTARLRTWLRGLPATGPMFGASAVFTRKKPDA